MRTRGALITVACRERRAEHRSLWLGVTVVDLVARRKRQVANKDANLCTVQERANGDMVDWECNAAKRQRQERSIQGALEGLE